MARKLVIVDYDRDWPSMYQAEKSHLIAVIGGHITDIQHIGSTSVPGLGAKPVIDIMIGVETLSIADAHCIKPIINLGYEYVQQFQDDIPFQRYFRKLLPDGNHTHHIHLVEITHPWWERHIVFRDYLREHPQVCKAYEKLKRDLAPKFTSGSAYADAKTEFIRSIETRAFAWKKSQESA